MKLPSWTDCEERVDAGESTVLEQFIYDNEPASPDSVRWRFDLRMLIEKCSKYTR